MYYFNKFTAFHSMNFSCLHCFFFECNMYKDWDSFEGHCITLHTIVTIGLSWEYFVQFNPNSVSYCAL